MPRVLCVTGAYAPEFSAGGLQARAIAARLHGRAEITVLTTATDASLPTNALIDGIQVRRVHVDPGGRPRVGAAMRLLHALGSAIPNVDLVHVQGYSAKNVPVTAAARAFGRPVILHLQTSRHDEPPAVRAQGAGAWWSFSSADRFISVSPALKAAAVAGGIDDEKIVVVPNGVDANRFTPAHAGDRARLRQELGISMPLPMVLFVGVMMPDKQPQVAFEAWSRLQANPATASTLVFVGATNPNLYELGDRLAERLKADAVQLGLADRVSFVEPTADIERYFRAADLFIMPSVREGCPNVMLEAMASGVPVVASRLPGATDAIVTHGVDGRLADVGDVNGFATEIAELLTNRDLAAVVGRAGRATVEKRFAIEHVAEQWLEVYEQMLSAG